MTIERIDCFRMVKKNSSFDRITLEKAHPGPNRHETIGQNVSSPKGEPLAEKRFAHTCTGLGCMFNILAGYAMLWPPPPPPYPSPLHSPNTHTSENCIWEVQISCSHLGIYFLHKRAVKSLLSGHHSVLYFSHGKLSIHFALFKTIYDILGRLITLLMTGLYLSRMTHFMGSFIAILKWLSTEQLIIVYFGSSKLVLLRDKIRFKSSNLCLAWCLKATSNIRRCNVMALHWLWCDFA